MALTLGDNFSYQGAKPLDARLKYDTLAVMKAVADSTMYDGCLAYCVAMDKTYQWKSTNTVDTDTGKWREFSSGSGSSVVSGYYKEADHLFYEESTYTTPIAGAANTIYISVDTNKSYRYNGSIFVRIDEEEGQVVQIATLPTASADNLGKIYEYVGATTQDCTNGVFYKCVFDGTSTYSWEVCDVVDTLSADDVTDVKNAFAVQTYVDRGIVIDERGTESVVGVVIDSNGDEHKLYQKAMRLTLNNVTVGENNFFPINASVESYYKLEAFYIGSSGSVIPFCGVNFPNGKMVSNEMEGIKIFANDSTAQSGSSIIIFVNNSSWVSGTVIAIVQYTKTT